MRLEWRKCGCGNALQIDLCDPGNSAFLLPITTLDVVCDAGDREVAEQAKLQEELCALVARGDMIGVVDAMNLYHVAHAQRARDLALVMGLIVAVDR